MLHFKKVHSSWHGDAMHQCVVGAPCFEINRQALLDALCKVKNGKSSGNCAYPIDLVKHHKHVQLEVSTLLNLVFGIWEFDIDLRVSLFLGLVVTSVNTLLVFGTYWD